MSRPRVVLAVLALLMILLAWWQVAAARSGLVVAGLERERVPMLYVAPAGARGAPGVLIAHGFAGSKQIMLGYGYTLAHAGYAVMLWDFDGHAANGAPMGRDALQQDVDRAYAALLEQPEVDPQRVAILGHSMGSGAAMTAGIREVARYTAVVAISPTGAEVTPRAPRNLFFQAGSWEGRFVANAERLLAAAGGASDDFTAGRARRLTVIPNAEHITILFRPESHRAALDWLNAAFGETRTTTYSDRRILWYLLHLLGWLGLLVTAVPLWRRRLTPARVRARRLRWAGLILGPLAASGLLALINSLWPVQGIGGITVGGAVALWLLIAGAVWCLLGCRLAAPGGRELLLGVGLFGLLWVAFGALAQTVWVQWLLIPVRLLRWPILAAACLPWFVAAGAAGAGDRRRSWALGWLAQSAALVGGLLLALSLVPSLGFLVLLLPLLPVIIGILAVAGAAARSPWTYGSAGALFFGWVLAAIFPLAG